MALLSVLDSHDQARTGRLKYVAMYTGSLTGLQEPQKGWILCNGATIPSTGSSPTSGLPYQPLSDLMLAKGGSRIAAPITGKIPMTKGTSPTGRSFSVFANTDYSTNGVITLTLSNYPRHRQRLVVLDPEGPYGDPNPSGSTNQGAVGYGSEPFPSGINTTYANQTTGAQGGGGSHNNLPPVIVVGAILVKL